MYCMNTAATPTPVVTVIEERALSLLGSGIAPVTVAASLGITPGRISQLLSDENFAARVAELRYNHLAKHNERDDRYDNVESTLIERLEEAIPMMHRPLELLRAIQVINGAKRRGASTPEAIVEKQAVVQLVVPIQILNKFQTNQQGQVVTVGEQDLLTIQSGALDGLVRDRDSQKVQDRVGALLDDAKSRENGNGSSTVVTRITGVESDQ